MAADVAAKRALDDRKETELIAKGTPAIRLVYQDGGGHPSLRKLALAAGNPTSSEVDERTRRSLGDISRPEALAEEPRENSVSAPSGAASANARR